MRKDVSDLPSPPPVTYQRIESRDESTPYILPVRTLVHMHFNSHAYRNMLSAIRGTDTSSVSQKFTQYVNVLYEQVTVNCQLN